MIKATMKQLYEKLALKVGICIKRQNIPFVVGGSRDLFQGIVDAYSVYAKEGPLKVTFLQITH